MYGIDRLLVDLCELGYEAVRMTASGQEFAVIPSFEVPLGRFRGRSLDLGLPAPPNFPQAVGASIHVRAEPQLFDYSDTKSGVRNIIASPLGPEWRYWSHSFGWTGERTTRRLLSQVHTIFANA